MLASVGPSVSGRSSVGGGHGVWQDTRQVDSASTVGSCVMALDLERLIATTPELAAMPATSARLLTLLEDPDVPIVDVVGVIETDPALTANVLKLCNSAYYGLRGEVATVREALIRLGNQTVLTLAFASSMGRLLQAPVTGYRLPRGQLWRHALAVGLVGARLGPDGMTPTDRNRVFTAGVVHDIGKLLLDRPLRESLRQLPPEPDYSGLVLAERDLLGCDHAEAGAVLGGAWNFPSELVAVIGNHHRPAPAGSTTSLVLAADLLASRAGQHGGAPGVGEQACELAAQAAGLTLDAADERTAQALADLEGLLSLLGVN
ncbi:HDOD domain-containing protein [bacterium]|nr:HDOD domain-containing protein [bacterium]